MRYARKYATLVVVLAFTVACAGNRSPAAIAGTAAHNGTIVITAVDKVQRFIASEEAAGRVPRNEAVTAMEAIGKGLAASKQASGYVEQLSKLDPGSTATEPLIVQLQAALSLASTQSALALVPISNPAIRGQIGLLVGEVNTAIGSVQQIILSLQRK